ncbi:unnamed protein product [Phytophthora fragariaefolia]|uniref:Unnamed protein product n=1 Tax=Phytophthora fragariaefolia TaxID=1490495 RepID=A0A9W6XJ22_9STRA|nr:unnamed protein product [Phytophthora fragariaefolia]
MHKRSLSRSLGHDYTWLQALVALLMAVGILSVAWELVALHTQRSFLSAFDELESDVASDDLLHLSYLQTACSAEKDVVLPVSFAAPGSVSSLEPSAHFSSAVYHERDPRLVDELRQCPDVDIYMPAAARGLAGCAAVAGPLKFLHSRLLPDWAFDAVMYDIVSRQSTSYFQLCPDTPMLFLSPEHVLKLTKHAAWPATKPVYLLAPGVGRGDNAETRAEGFTRSVLDLTDAVLCQTTQCYQDVTSFLGREGDARKTRVLYTSQVTADPANYARRILGDEAVPEKNSTHFVDGGFAHTTWDIESNTTKDVIKCWSKHKDVLPPLDVFLLKEEYNGQPSDGARMHKAIAGSTVTQIQIFDELLFARIFSNSTFFVCPTAQDDCLHLARASGGVIVTRDGYPKDELLSGSGGVFFSTSDPIGSPMPDDSLLLPAPEASYRSSDLCIAVIKAYGSTSVDSRWKLATQARRRYNEDARLFKLRMLELRALAHHNQPQKQRPNLHPLN